MVDKEYSLYFHVPFCQKKCDYCHFFVIPDQERFKITYMEALRKEWAQKSPLLQEGTMVSLYFGGGTPALLGAKRVAAILDWVPASSQTEISLETNPENTTQSLIQDYKDAGINRLSIGIQAFDDALLMRLGRTHSALEAQQAVLAAYQAGISNLSIDLMYDLPGQTLAMWEKTLDMAFALPISHLSLYNLTIEPHTVFFKKRSQLKPYLPDADTSLHMLELAIEKADQAGFIRYEISAFAKPGKQSIHNTGYWTNRPFLGLGPSAYSFWEGSRFCNIARLSTYCKLLEEGKPPIDFSETLSPRARLKEYVAVRLRLVEGVPSEIFSQLPPETQTSLCEFESLGWLKFGKQFFHLTPQGLLFHDRIAEELIEID